MVTLVRPQLRNAEIPMLVTEFGDGDARQAETVIERIISNAGHGVTYGDTRQNVTVLVFVSRFISTICELNDRKVMTLILSEEK